MRNSTRPLSYMGVQASTPPNFRTENRAPTTSDYKSFYISDIWHQKATENLWMLTKKAAGVATWTSLNSTGSGSFTDVTITTGDLTLNTGDVIISSGDLKIEAINYTSILRTDASGVVSGLADGNDGQLLIGATGSTPIWANLTSTGGTVTITNTANSINIESAGAVGGNTFTMDDLNTISPTGAGNVIVAGGTNIGTTGTVANTITINLDDNITLTSITVDDITINNSLKSVLEINTQTGISYTLQLTDQDKEVQFTTGAAVTLNIPTNAAVAFPIGAQIGIVQYGAGQVTVTPAGGVTVNSIDSKTKTEKRYAACLLTKQDNDEWLLSGQIST
jgi:hypothetical protein